MKCRKREARDDDDDHVQLGRLPWRLTERDLTSSCSCTGDDYAWLQLNENDARTVQAPLYYYEIYSKGKSLHSSSQKCIEACTRIYRTLISNAPVFLGVSCIKTTSKKSSNQTPSPSNQTSSNKTPSNHIKP